jgi:hypothetical protein
MRIVITLATCLALSRVAMACPSCPTARLARAAICGPRFFAQLAAVLAPLLVLVAIVWFLRRIDRPRREVP